MEQSEPFAGAWPESATPFDSPAAPPLASHEARNRAGQDYLRRLQPYLRAGAAVKAGWCPRAPIRYTQGMRANAHYFSHPKWTDDWLARVHRYEEWRERWHAVTGSLDGKVLVDVGCGPGNVLATLGGTPRMAIGVDVAEGSLLRAAAVGYVPLQADAHDMPLASGIADIVAINGSLHHCDDMAAVLAEAARLVKPGGLLVTDHDPQFTAWDFRGVAMLMWRLRVPIYRWLKRGGHDSTDNEQYWALATELHHRPGDGMTESLLRGVLEQRGWQVKVHPHNHYVGAEVFEGKIGPSPLKMRVAQRLSGIRPGTPQAAMSLFCVARAPGADGGR
ncbi:class I SAM-dependent methyltransferase [Cupriavidus sp.]|uniref:class I SAM-dependent methyltransferase n=2 Tax=unclassified Cupriavidus TaxID=2640874 RepID=UPI0025C11049|nr:class I SAM-dependent methyltransferase [Cupriavidus sp.]MCA3185821.1 class I SAM-dependent methyltransferase [Cupriavidus sp.]MCA3190813.1 class I SAM-dependent methyltransferase [Cupriavidus sp.]MCA3199100.1 class I SAM-dependent methyltransferase [Cupriavidus sp.]MCA3205037.1 class I SAM-dependent methyltransferase [Cupriavidus sp.]MCA3209108.1 class I SAM-dependent methyltransferase [Cupriavidus sp.]